MGIRKRVKLGFIALALILFSAGVSSFMEMGRLGDSSHKIVDIGSNSVRLSISLLDLMQQHSSVIYEYSVNENHDNFVNKSESVLKELDSLTTMLLYENTISVSLNKILEAKNLYIKNVRERYNSPKSSFEIVYTKEHLDAYWKFVNSVKDYMIQSQQYVLKETAEIDNGIHRSKMFGAVAISAMVLILIVFYYLLDVYYLRPIVSLTSSLHKYLLNKTPFVVNVDGRDEVYTLKELILDLISENRNRKAKKRDDDMFFND